MGERKKHISSKKKKKKKRSGKLSGSVLMHVERLQPVHSPCLAYFYFIRHTAERITGTEGSGY